MTATRGTTNRNDRGSSEARRRRREWLVETFRANQDLRLIITPEGSYWDACWPGPDSVPACRCYRCGKLLTVSTVTVDRIIPGARGGTYRRNNIRPACAVCNSETGGQLRWSIARAKVLMRTGAVPR